MKEPGTQPIKGDGARVGSPARLAAALTVFVLYTTGLIALGTPTDASETGAQVVLGFVSTGGMYGGSYGRLQSPPYRSRSCFLYCAAYFRRLIATFSLSAWPHIRRRPRYIHGPGRDSRCT